MADHLERQAHPRLSVLMLCIGLTPVSFTYIGVIMTDTLLASFFVAAFGLAIRFRGNAFSSAASLTLGVLGYLTRANGAFALPPLLLQRANGSLGREIIAALGIVLMAIPLSRFVNHQIFAAKRSGVERSLELFDLAGIRVNSGDAAVVPIVDRCYTPLFWDTLDSRCNVMEKFPEPPTRAWLRAIASHPLAYAEHRFRFFNQATFFLVPPMHQCSASDVRPCDTTPRGQVIDIIKKNAFVWPITWMAVGITLLALGVGSDARMLCLSGVLYGAAYLIVGVASEFRYFLWTELSVQAAIVLECANGRTSWRPVVFVASAICIAGYAARIAFALIPSV